MPLSGVLNVNKPQGHTSRDAVGRIERLVRPTRAGHAGTLDPLATGVLVVCVGQATRLIQYVQRMPKTYRATFLLGQNSETDDIESDLVPVDGAIAPARETLDHILPQFIGDIQQRPPAYSAIKLAGRRAYQLARSGVEVDLQPRTITIHNITLLRYAYPELELAVECGSGTYIRSLARDLGDVLGTGAVMSALERTSIGEFKIEDAMPLSDVNADTLSQKMQPALAAVADLPHVTLTAAQCLELRNGRPILTAWLVSEPSPSGRGQGEGAAVPTQGHSPSIEELVATDATGQLVAVLFEKCPGELWPRLNFNVS